jgi:flagellar capping protein FliD
MKYILPILFLLAPVFTETVFGQSIQPVIGKIMHNDAERTCLMVKLDPTVDQVEDEWEDYLKDNHDTKLSGAGFLGTGDLLVAEQVVISAISDKRMDFYTEIKQVDGKTDLRVFAAFGTDVYVEPEKYPEEYAAMENILHQFLKTYLPGYYEDEVSSVAKTVQSLKKDTERLDKKFDKKEKKIQKLQEEMDENRAEREEKQEKLDQQEALLKQRRNALEKILKQLGQLNQ